MRIAQVAPLIESVPPRTYGGTERIVSYLTEALVAHGHDVTLFAAGGSRTTATLYTTVEEPLRTSRQKRNPTIQHMLQLAEVVRQADRFDIVHFHTDYFHFPVWRLVETPQLTTLHGRLDLPDLADVYREFGDMSVVSISDSQRRPIPGAGWLTTVYNGVPADVYRLRPTPGDYLAFVGRFSPEKGPEQAIDIALRAGIPLKMAAKVDPVDEAYFDAVIRPRLDHPLLEYVGEVDETGKDELFGNALATLFPIAWPEPFGLTMIESMACGTPVIAFDRGAVREVMRDGVSGRIVSTVDEAVAVLPYIDRIDRVYCREYFESRFTADRMAADYLSAYRRLIDTPARTAVDPRSLPVAQVARGAREALAASPCAVNAFQTS